METYILRHGDAKYKQGKVNLSEANDLTPQGEIIVGDSARSLASHLAEIKAIAPIRLYSSPFGRCLHTATIFQNVLKNSGIAVESIQPDDSLEEVRNFDWNLFYPLVVGGEIDYQGGKISFDKSLTNPKEVSSIRYFRSDMAHNLNNKARKLLPGFYLDRIAQFERYPSVILRLRTWLNQNNPKGIGTIVCTHEGLTGGLIENLTGDKNAFLQRGKYIGVENNEGSITPYLLQQDAISYDS